LPVVVSGFRLNSLARQMVVWSSVLTVYKFYTGASGRLRGIAWANGCLSLSIRGASKNSGFALDVN